jgi:hypothetical protein
VKAPTDRFPDAAATVVCIIGTPRSGTSLTARILNLAGVYLGPESEMRPAGPWNPKGFWENRHVGALNRRLLNSLDRRDPGPPKLPAGWASSAALAGEREEARTLLSETFAGRRLWGWKEAGSTLVLPFWQELLPQMRYVICLRNPVDIAASVEQIEGQSASEVLAAWPAHVAAALAYTAGRPRLLVTYDDYLHSRRQTVERLWHFVGNQGSPTEEQSTKLEAPIDDSLLHHRTAPAETLGDGNLPLDATSMYLMVELLRRAIPEPCVLPGQPASTIQAAVDAYAQRVIGGHSP